MEAIFAGHGKHIPAYFPIDSGLSVLHAVGGASLHFDDTQDFLVPPNEADFAVPAGGAKIAGDGGVSVSSKIEAGIFFTAAAGAEVFRNVAGERVLLAIQPRTRIVM